MDIFNESIGQKERFKIAANKLLNNSFVLKRKEETRNDYIFVIQNKSLFIEYFELLGYELIINETSGVITIINTTGTGRLNLRKIESIILLILRLLYIEKKSEISLNEDVVVLADEIHDKYNMLKVESKPNIDKTSLREAVRIFKRYNLIKNLDTDVTKSDSRIIIYPSILFAITNDNINNLYEELKDKLGKYINGDGDEGSEDD